MSVIRTTSTLFASPFSIYSLLVYVNQYEDGRQSPYSLVLLFPEGSPPPLGYRFRFRGGKFAVCSRTPSPAPVSFQDQRRRVRNGYRFRFKGWEVRSFLVTQSPNPIFFQDQHRRVRSGEEGERVELHVPAPAGHA